MASLINFFECGKYTIRGKGNLPAGDYYCVKFSDISAKIEPFFKKHIIRPAGAAGGCGAGRRALGIKFRDFQDWSKVADLMQKNAHNTPVGLYLIRQIKSGMNTGRKWK